MASSSSNNVFELLSRACVSPAEYTLKALYVALSVVAIACVLVVLLRIGWRHARQKSTTSIGRLVEYLVVVQGTFDLIYHTVDLVFALDCNAPPLFTLLTSYSDNIYAKPTFAYNVAKEGFGYCSLLWHAHVAHCMYSWIVLKVSAIRLRRRRIPLLVLGTAAAMVVRYYLYWKLRDGMLGLYLSTIIYDVVMVPSTVAVMLRYYCLTMQALGEHSQSQQEEQLQQQQQRSLQQLEAGHEPQSIEWIEPRSAQRAPRPDGLSPSRSFGRLKAQSDSSLVDLPNPFHMSGPSQQQLGAAPDAGGRSAGGVSSPRMKMKKPKSNKNLLIIQRLMRISLSVAVVWLVLASVNMYTWAYFWRHGEVRRLRWLLILRLVFLRLIGTVDAVFLGDLFALCVCRPCTRSLRHALVRLRQQWETRSPLPLPFLNPFSSGISSLASLPGSADSPIHTSAMSRAPAPASMSMGPAQPPQHQEPRRFSFFGGSERAGPSLFSRSSGSEGSVVRPRDECEEEAAAVARWAEELQRKRAPKRQLTNLEILASTYNMGGVDRESCCIPSGGGNSSRKSALQMVIPLWIPRGYDLYVIGVQECQILRELREAIVEHLGGPQAYTFFGQDIGSEVVLHGRIAVTLFVRTADVVQGRFKMHHGVVDRVAAGVSLGPLGKAENKGMVGLSCMYGDATLAVISAHFASDSHGRNKLAKRNAHACTTLRELSLHFENDCDAHLQHHHTIMLGDLNYRCIGTPNDVLSQLHRTARQLREQAAASNPSSPSSSPSNWRTLSYARLFEPCTPYRFPLEAPPPDLPRCLAAQGPRISYSAAPYPLLAGASSVGWSGFSHSLGPVQGGASSSYASGRSSPPPPSSPRPLESGAAKSAASSAASVGPDEGKQQEQQQQEQQQQEQQQQARSGTPPLPPAPSRQQQQSSYVSSPLRHEQPAAVSSSAPSGASSVRSAGSWSTQQSLLLPATATAASADADDAWAWARQLDELSRSLRQRLVFYGFVEGPLHFPPSYRWNRVPAADYLLGGYQPGQGGLAGDHADEERLRAAYSTVVPAKPGLLNRALSRVSSALSAGSGGTAAGAAGAATNAGRSSSPPPTPAALSLTKSTSSAVGGTLRTPSWTDRVLTHSLPGKAPLLRWRAYDMADDVGLSDHRPVSSHLTLLVDADFAPPRQEDCGRGAGLALFTITIPRLPIVTLQKKGSALLPSTSEVSILFPLTGEDPIASSRKASSLGEVMPGFSHHAALQRTASSTTTSSLSHFTLSPSTFPLRLRTVACPRRSEHLLLKINDREKEVGQVCVPLAPFLPQSEEAAAPPATPAGLPTDATVDSWVPSCEELVEGTQQARLLRGGRGGGLCFPLTSGGAFKGWVQLEIRVRVRPLDSTD